MCGLSGTGRVIGEACGDYRGHMDRGDTVGGDFENFVQTLRVSSNWVLGFYLLQKGSRRHSRGCGYCLFHIITNNLQCTLGRRGACIVGG